MKDFGIFAGSAIPELAAAIARELGLPLGACAVERFPDGETWVGLDEPVRGRDVFIVQSTSPPVNESLLELLAFADACRRASAARITAIVPYFGYARQDKRHGRREPITASMVALLLQAVGINHVVTVDLHTPQIEGFFQIPVDSLTAVPTL
ncbi:MAG TPA: ribose-phosphate diphosphokinase, partial [Blastocatellia bacterium]|nr:ribose-phosphate diphosphokinase [Blastocatellia bacterium]